MNAHEVFIEILTSSPKTLSVFAYALLGGFVPALFWLWFWLHEEYEHKEPKKVIVTVFLLGMLAVFVSYFLQKGISIYLTGKASALGVVDFENKLNANYLLTLIYVIIEEVTKFGAAYVIAFKTRVFDEPIDAFIYLMTAAVGFAAMENTLFLVQPLLHGATLETVITGHMRFIGSSVLHVASSGSLSVCIGLAFCKSFWNKELYVWGGIALACAIHFAFNVFLVINDGSSAFLVFSSVWIVAIFLILTLEKVKQNKCF
jgi:RsiW-degrading membrane proteinase PrsW (M82 family)